MPQTVQWQKCQWLPAAFVAEGVRAVDTAEAGGPLTDLRREVLRWLVCRKDSLEYLSMDEIEK
jgi:hypothetical protein